MEEKRYPIELPRHVPIVWGEVQVTKAEAADIGAQCEKIKAEPDLPDLRIGDIWEDWRDGPYHINITGENDNDKPNWICSRGGTAVWCNPEAHTYGGNVFDQFQHGQIPVLLTEKEIQRILDEPSPSSWILDKFRAALATYRARKAEPQ